MAENPLGRRWPRTLTFPRSPDFIIGGKDDPYMRRWHVIPRNRWCNIYLHHFLHSDDDRAKHDHPWCNLSVLLWGTYLEHTNRGAFLRKPWRPWAFWRVIARIPTSAHRVELLDTSPVWTLFITGPVVREWGFYCPQGWRHWREFTDARDKGSVGRGCE